MVPPTSSTTDESTSITTVTATTSTGGGHSEEALRALIANEMRRLSASSSHFPRKCCFVLGIYMCIAVVLALLGHLVAAGA